MLRITENVVSDISLSIVLDLIFFLHLFYFYLVESVLKEKRYKNSRQCLGFA